VISGLCCDVDKICTLLGYYAALNGNPLPTFWDSISVPSSGVKKSKKKKADNFLAGFLLVGLLDP
jgi:hypothetical protein